MPSAETVVMRSGRLTACADALRKGDLAAAEALIAGFADPDAADVQSLATLLAARRALANLDAPAAERLFAQLEADAVPFPAVLEACIEYRLAQAGEVGTEKAIRAALLLDTLRPGALGAVLSGLEPERMGSAPLFRLRELRGRTYGVPPLKRARFSGHPSRSARPTMA